MTGDGLTDAVLIILGNIFIIILAARAVGYYAKREWGDLITHIAAGVLIAAIIYFPEQVIDMLEFFWNAFAG